MSHLQALGVSDEFVKDYLVSLICNGATVMPDYRGGVTVPIKEIIF